MSFTSVDLPEPDTPVTQMKLPTGKSTSMFFRLCCVAPITLKKSRSCPRFGGTAITGPHERNCAVTDQLLRLGQLERVEELERPRHRQLRELVDRLLADRDREHLRLQARALADRARTERHVFLDALALL